MQSRINNKKKKTRPLKRPLGTKVFVGRVYGASVLEVLDSCPCAGVIVGNLHNSVHNGLTMRQEMCCPGWPSESVPHFQSAP